MVDIHERASGIPVALQELGVLVKSAPLPAGDYAVGAETIVERKSVLDLHGPSSGGAFWPQLGALRAECRYPYLVPGDDGTRSASCGRGSGAQGRRSPPRPGGQETQIAWAGSSPMFRTSPPRSERM